MKALMTRPQFEALLARRAPELAFNIQLGQYRITTKDGGRDLSPRMPFPDATLWFDGYITGKEEVQRGNQS